MNKETRKALRAAVIAKMNDDMLPLEVGGHTITNQLVYAGCSQWSCAGREWEDSQSTKDWIVDGQYQLTFTKLDYFDGHNQIERQTKYYLQPDRSETPPDGPIGEPLRKVPDAIMLEIAQGLDDAIAAHDKAQAEQDRKALQLISGGDGLPIDLSITVTIQDKEMAEQVVNSLIRWEQDLRAQHGDPQGIPVTAESKLAASIARARRELQEIAGLVTAP